MSSLLLICQGRTGKHIDGAEAAHAAEADWLGRALSARMIQPCPALGPVLTPSDYLRSITIAPSHLTARQTECLEAVQSKGQTCHRVLQTSLQRYKEHARNTGIQERDGYLAYGNEIPRTDAEFLGTGAHLPAYQ